MRLYPQTHPAVVESLRQIGEALPGLAALGTVEWKVGVTGLHWHGQHLLPRNAQIAELAGLLYARGVRAVTLNPGMVPEHVLAVFQVATGAVPPDDATLGRIALTLGRRTSARLERLRLPTPAADAAASPALATPEASAPPSPASAVTTEQSTASAADTLMAGKRASSAFRPDVLPVDVEVKRAVAALGSATTPEEQSAAVDKLAAVAPQLLGLHDVAVVAEAIAALDRLLPTAQDPKLTEAIDQAALALSERSLVERLVHRLGSRACRPGSGRHWWRPWVRWRRSPWGSCWMRSWRRRWTCVRPTGEPCARRRIGRSSHCRASSPTRTLRWSRRRRSSWA